MKMGCSMIVFHGYISLLEAAWLISLQLIRNHLDGSTLHSCFSSFWTFLCLPHENRFPHFQDMTDDLPYSRLSQGSCAKFSGFKSQVSGISYEGLWRQDWCINWFIICGTVGLQILPPFIVASSLQNETKTDWTRPAEGIVGIVVPPK